MSAEEVFLPKWGTSMQEGTLGAWLVAVGDTVSEGDPLVSVETEKVDAEVEAPVAGTVIEILAAEGDVVPVGDVLARIQP